MNPLKNPSNQFFTCLPNWLRGKLSPNEGWLLWVLKSHHPHIFPSISTLAKEAGICAKTVSTTLNKLAEKKLIERKNPYQDGNKKRSNDYTLLLDEITYNELVLSGNEHLIDNDTKGECQETLTEPPLEVGKSYQGRLVNFTNKEDKPNNKKNKPFTRLEFLSYLNPPLCPPVEFGKQIYEPVFAESALPADMPDVDAVGCDDCAQSLMIAPELPSDPIRESITHATSKSRPSRQPRFRPTAEMIPAALLPVESELFEFWSEKRGAKTQDAWRRMIRSLLQIQSAPDGGTEIVRSQLRAGAEAGWQGITVANWEKFGQKARTGQNASRGQGLASWAGAAPRGLNLIAAAEALASRREELTALRYQNDPQGASETLLGASESVSTAELVA